MEKNLSQAINGRDQALAQLAALTESQSTFHDQIDRLKAELSQSESRQTNLLQDINNLRRSNREATENYEREVILRSQKIQECSVLNERLRTIENTFKSSEAELDSLRAGHQNLQNETSLELSSLRKALQESQQHADHFKKHNELLHAQIAALNERLAVRAAISASLSETTTNAEQSVDHSKEIIQHLRREKSVLEAKVNLAEQESLRSRLNLEQTKRLLKESQQRISELVARQDSLSHSATDHAKMMEDLQQLNLLRESNLPLPK